MAYSLTWKTEGELKMELGIIAGLAIILLLELSRSFRTIKKHNNDIQELRDRISNLENSLKKQ